MRGIAGILNPGKPFTTLANGVCGVTRVICEGAVLDRTHWWCVNNGGVEGKPTRYAVRGRKVYVWPIPDRPYRVDLEWGGLLLAYDDVLFDCPMWWMDMYERELGAAERERR